MADFLLIHGSWHGAWCWREVAPRLETCGHRVLAIDLPAHGADQAAPETVCLQEYVSRVIETIALFENPPLLVGHSMGLISLVSEQVPEQVRALVYISGLLPPNGTSLMQTVEGFDPRYLAQIEFAPDRRTARLSAAGLRDFLYNCCPTASVEAAFPLLTPESVAPYDTPFTAAHEKSGRVPRYYIECLRDRVIPLALQRSMRDGLTFAGVYSLDTDHAPFFSAPDELTAVLHTIAAQA